MCKKSKDIKKHKRALVVPCSCTKNSPFVHVGTRVQYYRGESGGYNTKREKVGLMEQLTRLLPSGFFLIILPQSCGYAFSAIWKFLEKLKDIRH
jgi:hypothetical protein